jgi:hypothetical protein
MILPQNIIIPRIGSRSQLAMTPVRINSLL